jgi:hypothetical protein
MVDACGVWGVMIAAHVITVSATCLESCLDDAPMSAVVLPHFAPIEQLLTGHLGGSAEISP